MGDWVLGDLGDDPLLGLERLLDPGTLLPFHVIGVELHVPPVEDGVLRGTNIDKSSFHPGEDVLHPCLVHIAVDLVCIVCWTRHVVLDQGSAFEDRQLGDAIPDADAHQVAPDRLAPSFAAPPSAEGLLV